MKTGLTTTLLLWSTAMTAQQNVSLKFTYNSQAVCNYEITIKHGDAAIGKGNTDNNGDVSFEGVPLLSKSIDVYGYKKTANGEKTFDMKGYVTLNEEYYAHIKMEELLKEMTDGSVMPQDMFAAAWGLTELDCGGTKPAATESHGTTEKADEQKGDTAESAPTTDEAIGMSLQAQEQGYMNEITALDKKISKQEGEIEQLKVAGATAPDIEIAMLELDELKWKRERKKVYLERNRAQQAGMPSDADMKKWKDQAKGYEDKEDEARAKRKEIEKEKKEAAKLSDGDKTTGEKAGEKLDAGKLKIKIGSLKTQIKMKENALTRAKEKSDTTPMTPEALAEKEKEIAELKAELAALEKQAEGK
ncbi:MAG: hypothetical protein ACKVOR_05595 [Flavobacteriales bacterium]